MLVHGTKAEAGVGKTRAHSEQTAGMTAATVAQCAGDLHQVPHSSQHQVPSIVEEVGAVEVIVGEEVHDGGGETTSSLMTSEVVAQRSPVEELVVVDVACVDVRVMMTHVAGDPCRQVAKEVVAAWRRWKKECGLRGKM